MRYIKAGLEKKAVRCRVNNPNFSNARFCSLAFFIAMGQEKEEPVFPSHKHYLFGFNIDVPV